MLINLEKHKKVLQRERENSGEIAFFLSNRNNKYEVIYPDKNILTGIYP